MSLNSFFFFKITRSSRHQQSIVSTWYLRKREKLTELEESILVFNGFDLAEVVNVVGTAISVSQLVLEGLSNLSQENKHKFLVVLSLGNGQVDDALSHYEARQNTCYFAVSNTSHNVPKLN